MVRVAGKNCVLDAGGEQKSPPLPFIEVDEATARALIGTGVAVLVGDEIALAVEQIEPEDSGEAGDDGDDAETGDDAGDGGNDEGNDDAGDDAGETGADDSDDEVTGDEQSANAERRQAIIDAFDLLEPAHFVKTGARTGKPKLSAVEDITEIRDLTVAEIDALFDTREGAE